MNRITDRLNAIADALESASIQARLLADEMDIKSEDMIAEINRRTQRFVAKATDDTASTASE